MFRKMRNGSNYKLTMRLLTKTVLITSIINYLTDARSYLEVMASHNHRILMNVELLIQLV